MKSPQIIFALLFCARIVLGQDATSPASVVPAPCYPCAISNVISQFGIAIRHSYLFVQPTPHDNLVAQINHLPPPKPHPVLSVKRLANTSAGIDTSECPDDFKVAWKNFIIALSAESTRPTNTQGLKDLMLIFANPVHGLAAAASDAENSNIQKEAKKTAVQDTFLQLRLVCSSYGVK